MAFSDIIAAAGHGAALVYHEIVAIQEDATTWSGQHPEIGQLIAAGTAFTAQAMAGAGVPVPAFVTAGTAVLSALKAMAAMDPTLQSGAPSVSKATGAGGAN